MILKPIGRSLYDRLTSNNILCALKCVFVNSHFAWMRIAALVMDIVNANV